MAAARISTFDDWIDYFRAWLEDIDLDPAITSGYQFEAKYGDLHAPAIEFGDFRGGRKWETLLEVPDQRIRDALLHLIELDRRCDSIRGTASQVALPVDGRTARTQVHQCRQSVEHSGRGRIAVVPLVRMIGNPTVTLNRLWHGALALLDSKSSTCSFGTHRVHGPTSLAHIWARSHKLVENLPFGPVLRIDGTAASQKQ